MSAVTCADCGLRYLLSVHSVVALHTLEPGVVAVELVCHRGHSVSVLSGRTVTAVPDGPSMSVPDPQLDPTLADIEIQNDRDIPRRVPVLWRWAYADRQNWWARMCARLVRLGERQAWLSEWYLRGLHS